MRRLATSRATRSSEGRTGAEKSRDMTIYGDSGVDGPKSACPVPSILFPFLEHFQGRSLLPSTLLSLLLPSSPLGFPYFSSNGSLSIPPHTRTISYRPPTGYNLPCVRFFRLSLPMGDTISHFGGILLDPLLLFYTAN